MTDINQPAKITQKIIGYAVKKDNGDIEIIEDSTLSVDGFLPIKMNESISRPDILIGSTYKIKIGAMEHAIYVTINDLILNEGSDHEHRWPYEVFINSKDMSHFQWVLALTRLISAVFRKGGDIIFMVDELKQVFDPQGGIRERNILHPSLVAKIGSVIEGHMKSIGLIKSEELTDHAKEILEHKRQEFEMIHGNEKDESGFPEKAVMCNKCNIKAVVLMDGCMTCLNCGDSKCQ